MADENDLEIALIEMLRDEQRSNIFYFKLLSSDLFVLTTGSDRGEGEKIADEDTNVAIVNYEMKDGTPYIPVFTSFLELQRSIEGNGPYLAMCGQDILPLIKNTDIIINPVSKFAIHIRPHQIEEILNSFSSTQNLKN